ncbi:hypothetical protein IFM89_010141, partial [Coptis chinensis]
VETGFAITSKYPSVVLEGDNAMGGIGHDKAVKALISGFYQGGSRDAPFGGRAELQEYTGIKFDRSVG